MTKTATVMLDIGRILLMVYVIFSVKMDKKMTGLINQIVLKNKLVKNKEDGLTLITLTILIAILNTLFVVSINLTVESVLCITDGKKYV
jgi:hypothetical protein